MEARSVIGTVLSDRYRLESKLGSGGMSTVYLARDETLERLVAVKVLHREVSDRPDQIERFRREARAVAQLSHPNVVGVIDAGEDGGYPYIVFEYVEGETLKQRIGRLGRLPLDEAAAYAIETGRGLAAAHARSLVHRDVKPQNVLIDSEGRAKVTDFGIARSLDTAGLTATGRVLGTTDYVSPEQAMGHAVDARSDIYSLGVVLYEMLIGDVPFHADTQVGVAMKHVQQALPDVQRKRPEISAALAAVVDASVAKDPDHRYPHMQAMLRDLEAALEVEVARSGAPTGEVTTVLESVPAKRRRLLTRRRISWAGALMVLAAGAVAILIAALAGEEKRGRAEGATPVKAATADDFDPPPGDLEEHGEEVGSAVDGDPTGTAWSTETYQTEDLGKPGVGLWVDAGGPVVAEALEVRSATEGWDAKVYGRVDEPLSTDALSDWGTPIGSATDVGKDEAIPLRTDAELQYFLIWITRPADAEGGYRVEIADVLILT